MPGEHKGAVINKRGWTSGTPKKLTVNEFIDLATEYIEQCHEEGRKMTLTGLCIHLGFAQVTSLHNYLEDPDYKQPVGMAMMHIANCYEQQVADGRGDGGVVFALKNMKVMGWSDKQDLNHTSSDGSMTPKDHSMAVLDALKRKHDAN